MRTITNETLLLSGWVRSTTMVRTRWWFRARGPWTRDEAAAWFRRGWRK